jgi:PAS domain S-box-containing protein
MPLPALLVAPASTTASSPMDPDRTMISAEETAALLAGSPFAERLDRGTATIVAAGRPLRVLFANSAALSLFAAPDRAALEAHLFSPSSPGGRRLVRLAETAAAGPPRVESLRFWLGRRPLPLALMCGRIGDRLVLAAPPAADEIRAASLATPPEPQREPPPRRFLWRLDGEERFGAVDPALAAAFGDYAPQAGESLAAFRSRAGFDRDARLGDALAARRTFAALPTKWGDGDGARVALMSGAPEFDRERRFAGWRGFGLFTEQTATDEPSAPATEAPAAPPPAEAAPEPPLEALQDVAPLPPAPPVRPAPPAERSAEIVLLRPAAPAAANVVPIRPGAMPLLPTADEPRRGGDDNVELSSHERDAFREIARALGARLPGHGDDGAPRDLLDLAPPSAVEPSPAAAGVAGANAEALLDLLPIGAMVLRGGEPLYLNRTLLELVGYSDLAEFRAADGLKRMFRGRDAQTLAESGEGGAIPLIAAGGELIAVDARAEAIAWDGAPATLLSLRRSREIEHQERLRSAEREARDLRALLDSAADGVVTLDDSGRVLAMSRGAETLFGYDAKEVAGESFLALFAPQSQSEAAARFERARREETPARGEELFGRDQRGQALALAMTLTRFTAAGAPPRYCAALRDLGPSKATERALETARDAALQADARKTEFLARVSHEVRTPLHAILGFAEVMMEERFGPIGNDRYKDYIRDIHASARHVMSLANDLLDLAKIEAGKMELEFAPVDANRVVRECVSLMQPQAAQERIIMRLSLLERLPMVMADERALRQILLNLLSNAVKFNEPGGQVIVSTALDDAGAAVIRVRDTGVGMNENEIAAALEPFRQVGDAAQRAGGAGLGLPLTKALAEANHADFSIKSRKQQGTLVEVAFPHVKAAQ